MHRRLHFLALIALASPGCSPRAADPWGPAVLARMTVRERTAQLLMVPLDARAADAVGRGVGGVLLVGGDAPGMTAEVDSLQRMARLPLLVVADLDRGVGGVVSGATELPPAWRLPAGEPAAEAARVVAAEAHSVGINLARLSGPPLLGEGREPAGREQFAAALHEANLPGILRAFDPPAGQAGPYAWDRAALQAGALSALGRQARQAAGLELAWLAMPSLTGDTIPLPISPAGVRGLIRRDLGFAGVVVADLAEGGAWRLRFGPGAPVAALEAGADLLLGVADAAAAMDSVDAAVADGRLRRSRVEEASVRVFALKRALGLRRGAAHPDSAPAGPPPPAPADTAGAALRLHAAALRQQGRPAAQLMRCRTPVLVARDPRRLEVLARELARSGPRLRSVAYDPVRPIGDGDCLLVVSVSGDSLPLPSGPPPDSTRPGPRVIRAYLGGDPPAESAHEWAFAAGAGADAQRLLAGVLVGRVEAAAVAWPPAPVLMRAPAESAAMRADSLDAIDGVMRAALAGGVFTGAVVLVGRRGRLVKATGYGRTSGQPVAPDSTLFDLASLTKVVGTTAAAMTLTDDGRIGLDQPLRRYLSGFRGGERGEVTLRQLLTHTAGLPPGANLYGSRSPVAALRRVRRAELLSSPGSGMVYSDFGMILLAEGLRERAEEPLDELLARRVYVPLGMDATHFRPSILEQDRVVPTALRSERPYVLDAVVHDGNAFRLGGVAGHAGLFSTGMDVAVFAQTLLNEGAYGSRRVWTARTVRTFTARQSAPGARALGWDAIGPRSSAGDYFTGRSIGHTGYTGTSLWIDLERQLFVVLLTNRTYDRGSQAQIYGVRRRVHDLAARAVSDVRVLPRPGTAAARAAAERQRPRRPPARRPRRPGRRG